MATWGSNYVPVKSTYRPKGPVFRDAFIMCNNGGNDKSPGAQQIKGVPFQSGCSRFMLTGVDTPATMFKSTHLRGSRTGVARGTPWMSTAQASYKWPKKRNRLPSYEGVTTPAPVQVEARVDAVFDGFTQSAGRAPRGMSASASTPSLRRLQPLAPRSASAQSHRSQGQAFTPSRTLRGSSSTQALSRTQKAPLRRPVSESAMARTAAMPMRAQAQAY